VYLLSDADSGPVIAEPGSQVTLRNVRGDLTGLLNDQTGVWIDGPIMSKMASDASHQRSITNGPSFQHPWLNFAGSVVREDLGGSLSFIAPCVKFGANDCYVNVLSYTQFPISTTWKVTFDDPWSGQSCSYAQPTFTINGRTVTCIQNPTTFTNQSAQTIYAGEIVAYVGTDGAGGWVSFSGGTWKVTP
jgi:hypothetical protein